MPIFRIDRLAARWPRVLCLALIALLLVPGLWGCGRRPDPYAKQLSRALDAGMRGQELLSEGQQRRAERAFSRALEINQGIDNPAGTARQLNNLGAAAVARGDLPQAEEFFQQALFLNRESGDPAAAATNLANLATVAQKKGDFSRAWQYLSEARAQTRRTRATRTEGQILCQMAGLALDQYDPASAAGYLNEAQPLSREPSVKGPWHYQRGRLALARGNSAQAQDSFQQALAADRAVLNRAGMGADLEGLGQAWEQQGEFARAFLYYSRAFSLYTATQNMSRANRCLETLRRLNQSGALGQSLEPFERQLAAGQAAAAPCPPPPAPSAQATSPTKP